MSQTMVISETDKTVEAEVSTDAGRPSLPVVVCSEPSPGDVVSAAPGSCLLLRMPWRRGSGPWRVADCPPYLVPLDESEQGVLFLVFAGSATRTDSLRLVRELRGRPGVRDERLVAVSGGA